MAKDAESTRVLEYATSRWRFGIHLSAAAVSTVILAALNVWPHFETTVGPSVADLPEPELGWPWIFFFYGQTYGGYGPWWEIEHLVYDMFCWIVIVVMVGHIGHRLANRRNRVT